VHRIYSLMRERLVELAYDGLLTNGYQHH